MGLFGTLSIIASGIEILLPNKPWSFIASILYPNEFELDQYSISQSLKSGFSFFLSFGVMSFLVYQLITLMVIKGNRHKANDIERRIFFLEEHLEEFSHAKFKYANQIEEDINELRSSIERENVYQAVRFEDIKNLYDSLNSVLAKKEEHKNETTI